MTIKHVNSDASIEELLEMVVNHDYKDHSRDKKLKILQDLLS